MSKTKMCVFIITGLPTLICVWPMALVAVFLFEEEPIVFVPSLIGSAALTLMNLAAIFAGIDWILS